MSGFIFSLLPFTAYPYRGDNVVCNLCGSNQKAVLCNTDRRWKKLTSVTCSDCGLIRTDPMPTDDELDAYYRTSYRLDYQLAGKRPPKFHVVRSARGAAQRAEIIGDKLSAGAKVLDVGCGTGEFLKLARERGCETLGIEPGTTYADFARSEYNLDIINAPWQAARLPAESFDVISCHQVLEHLRDPMAAIAAMSRWLKPDGVLYISVPDMRGNDKPSFERFHFAHIYGFTPETLDAAMRLNGLRPRGAGQSCSTTTLFEKAEDPALEACAIRNSSRAEALRSAYPDDSVTAYVLGGGYFRHAAQRFRKWRADTFHSKVS